MRFGKTGRPNWLINLLVLAALLLLLELAGVR